MRDRHCVFVILQIPKNTNTLQSYQEEQMFHTHTPLRNHKTAQKLGYFQALVC